MIIVHYIAIVLLLHYIVLLLSKADLRNRYEHLLTWLAHLHPVLMRQQLDYQVFAVDQVNDNLSRNKFPKSSPNWEK